MPEPMGHRGPTWRPGASPRRQALRKVLVGRMQMTPEVRPEARF